MIEYWKGKLNKAEICCYELILDCLQKRIEKIDCPKTSSCDISKVYFAVYKDHPELFYMSNSPVLLQREIRTLNVLSVSRVSTSIKATNIYEKRTIDKCNFEIKKVIEGFNKAEDDYDTVLQCLDYIVFHTEYRVDNQLNQNAAAALCFHSAQCSGISKAVKLILDSMGIFCIVVEGKALDNANTMQPHAWNIVRVHNEYYHVDATFMLGSNPDKQSPLNRQYVFYDDNTMGKTHSWNANDVPICKDSSIYPTLKSKTNCSIFDQFDSAIETFNSLYEMKVRLRRMIDQKQDKLVFRINVPAADICELRRLIETSCKMVFGENNKVAYNLCIDNTMKVTLLINNNKKTD